MVYGYSQGVALAETIAGRQSRNKGPKVMVIAGVDREWEIRSAIERGVRGYLLVGCSLEELVEGVRVVHRGARYLSPQVATRLAEEHFARTANLARGRSTTSGGRRTLQQSGRQATGNRRRHGQVAS